LYRDKPAPLLPHAFIGSASQSGIYLAIARNLNSIFSPLLWSRRPGFFLPRCIFQGGQRKGNRSRPHLPQPTPERNSTHLAPGPPAPFGNAAILDCRTFLTFLRDHRGGSYGRKDVRVYRSSPRLKPKAPLLAYYGVNAAPFDVIQRTLAFRCPTPPHANTFITTCPPSRFFRPGTQNRCSQASERGELGHQKRRVYSLRCRQRPKRKPQVPSITHSPRHA